MKIQLILMLLNLPLFIYSQEIISMQDVEERREVSMENVNGKTTNGVYKYYAKGETEPFTGILFAKHSNGNFASWQEFINGVGQGKWINYYENGNLKEVGYYEQNLVQGPITKYYPNGNLKAKGTYKDWRVKIGVWEYYDRSGKLELTEDYGNKGNIDEVKEYYQRGEIPYSWYSNILTKNGFEI